MIELQTNSNLLKIIRQSVTPVESTDLGGGPDSSLSPRGMKRSKMNGSFF
jgi:hypothetical protein